MKTCINCGTKFPTKIYINNKRRNLQRRKYCLDCSPFGKRNTKILPNDPKIHKNSLIVGIKSKNYVCVLCERKPKGKRICNSCRTKIRRHRCKVAAVKLLGGKCNRCKWIGNIIAYEFHHKDPSNKNLSFRLECSTL